MKPEELFDKYPEETLVSKIDSSKYSLQKVTIKWLKGLHSIFGKNNYQKGDVFLPNSLIEEMRKQADSDKWEVCK